MVPTQLPVVSIFNSSLKSRGGDERTRRCDGGGSTFAEPIHVVSYPEARAEACKMGFVVTHDPILGRDKGNTPN
jgi:hypothetical protein